MTEPQVQKLAEWAADKSYITYLPHALGPDSSASPRRRKTSHARCTRIYCMMSTSTKPKCLIGGDEFGICVQRDSEQGGDELCSYCKDTHPIIMYWNLEQIALQPPELPSKLMLELIEEKSREKIYLNMYKVQLERVPPGKHVCVSRQERFRADHKGNEWVDTIKDIRSDRNGERSHEDKDLVLADYVVCDPVDGEAELCAKCLSNLQGQNPVKHMFSEDGKHLLPKFIGKGKKEPALEDKGVAMKEGRGRRVEE